MTSEMLDRVAQLLMSSARDTRDFSYEFKVAYDMPPTAMSKVHHLRSVFQALLTKDEAYELSSRRAEFGRIEFTNLESEKRFLLKSSSAYAIEQQVEAAGQLAFFPAPGASHLSDLHVIVFDFGKTDLTLSVAPAIELGLNKKVRVVGPLAPAGCWPLEDLDFREATGFDQDLRDGFDELGREDEEGSAGQ